MASTTWVGGDSGNETDWATGANWSTGSVPTTGAHVVIPNTTDKCALDQNRTIGSLTIQASGTIIGGGFKLIVQSEGDASGGTEHFAVNNDGRIEGELSLDITTPATTSCDFAGESGHGKFHDVTINHASCIVNLESTAQFTGDLTITLGKIVCGGNTVEVTGRTDIGPASGSADQATLQCDASAMFLGSGRTSSHALIINQGGTFTGGSGNHTIGSLNIKNNTNCKCTLTSGNTTIDGEDGSSSKAINIEGSNGAVNFSHGSGTSTVIITFAGNTDIKADGTTLTLNNLTINHASANINLKGNLSVAGNLEITAGELDTDSSNFALTVTGDIEIADGGAQLSYNDSTVTCARLGVGLGGVGKIDGTESGKIIVNGTGNVRILDLAGAILTGDTPTFEYQGQATTATQALSGLTSGTFNLIVNSDGASEKCIPNGSVTSMNDLTMTDGEFELPSSTNIEASGDLIIQANGVADLNPASSDGNVTFRSVVISSGGGLEAPSHGSFTLTGTLSAWSFQNNSTNFNHNNGTITQTNAGHIKSVSSNPMYNFVLNSASSDSHEAVFRPSSGTDCVIAANKVTVTRGIVKLNTVSDNASMGSLSIGSTGTFQASSGTTTITSEATDGVCLRSNGTFTHNSGLVSIETADHTTLVWASASQRFNNLTVNLGASGRVCTLSGQFDSHRYVEGNFTVTNCKFDTNNGATFRIDGDVSLTSSATLTCGTSTCSFGGIKLPSGTTLSASSGTTTITNRFTGESHLWKNDGGTFTHNNGTVKFNDNDHSAVKENTFYNVEVESNLGDYAVSFEAQGGGGNPFTILNNLTITRGDFELVNANDTCDIHGQTIINGSSNSAARFNNDKNQTGTITHHGLVTIIQGTYHVEDGATVNMAGIRNIGGLVD